MFAGVHCGGSLALSVSPLLGWHRLSPKAWNGVLDVPPPWISPRAAPRVLLLIALAAQCMTITGG